MNRFTGILLIIVGTIALLWSTFTYNTQERIDDGSPMQAYAIHHKTNNWMPYIGGTMVVVGIIIAAVAKKK